MFLGIKFEILKISGRSNVEVMLLARDRVKPQKTKSKNVKFQFSVEI